MRRSEQLVALAGGAIGAGASAIWGEHLAAVFAGALLGGSLGFARRAPRAAWIAATAALLAVAPYGTALPFGVYLFVPAHAFCAGRWDSRIGGVAALLTLVAACELGIAIADGPWVPFLLIPTATWTGGRALRERELLAQSLADRARELEQEREAYAQLSVRYERARLASELHDIVAHAISVMVVQASAGQRLLSSAPELTDETFEAIAGAARQAEADIGRLVALLSDNDADGSVPDLALVEELVSRAAGSGLDVTLRLEGELEGLPTHVVEAAYRVVQESLTNALRYASGAPVHVRLHGATSTLTVEVTNATTATASELAGLGTGNGLHGLRERVSACGGTLHAGATVDGGWTVSAQLPRRDAVRPP